MSSLRSYLALLAPVLVALAAACAPAAEEDADADEGAQTEQRPPDMRPELAQINDVSILYPLAKDAGELDGLLTAGTSARGGALVPKEIYEKAFGAPGTLQSGGTPAAPVHTGLHVVAARFDPCFAATGPSTDDASCQNQLRLVFQVVKVESGADDTAVHAFYSLSREELKDALQDVIAVRRAGGDERLGALAPHPLMKSEGLKGRSAKAINAIVTKYAGAENLTRFTVFTTSGLGTAWNFTGFDIARGEATRMKIPNLPDTAPMVAFFAGFRAGELSGEPPFTPAATGARAEDNMQLLGNGAWAARSSVSAEKRQAAFDAAIRIENPKLHSPDTVDCASCHAVEPARRIVGEKKLGLSLGRRDNAFAASSEFVPAADMKLTSVDTSGIDVHMFSYKGKVASVHQRTVNESADVVAYVNAKMLAARRR